MAGDTDFETHPELVRGYIGPTAIGPNSPLRRVERLDDGTEVLTGSVRYLVDPRIVEGTSWVTGANTDKKHVLDLVMGRDFIADGTIEAAEVREGDPAPDGSGPLHLARGIEIGHIFELGRKYSQALGLSVLDENGKARVVTMGSYGIGVSRVMAALAEANHDDRGLTWPVQIAPYHVQVLATGKDQAVFDVAGQIASSLDADGVEVLYDDRRKVSAGVKFADAELLGLPYTVVVGRDWPERGPWRFATAAPASTAPCLPMPPRPSSAPPSAPLWRLPVAERHGSAQSSSQRLVRRRLTRPVGPPLPRQDRSAAASSVSRTRRRRHGPTHTDHARAKACMSARERAKAVGTARKILLSRFQAPSDSNLPRRRRGPLSGRSAWPCANVAVATSRMNRGRRSGALRSSSTMPAKRALRVASAPSRPMSTVRVDPPAESA